MSYISLDSEELNVVQRLNYVQAGVFIGVYLSNIVVQHFSERVCYLVIHECGSCSITV